MDMNFKQRLQQVRCFVLDVDGVLTDGSVLVMPDELLRTMNIRDGYALHAAISAGYRVIVLSGGKSESVRNRLHHLGVREVYLGVERKAEKLKEILATADLKAEHILYMGDDLPDREVMLLCGIPACPQDAAPEIRGLSVYVSDKPGGKGCVRDVIEQTMRVQDTWQATAESITG